LGSFGLPFSFLEDGHVELIFCSFFLIFFPSFLYSYFYFVPHAFILHAFEKKIPHTACYIVNYILLSDIAIGAGSDLLAIGFTSRRWQTDKIALTEID
jgi:hypothetical protein